MLDSFADRPGHGMLRASRDAQGTHPLTRLLEDAGRTVRSEQLEHSRDVAPEASPVKREKAAHCSEPFDDGFVLGAVLEPVELGVLNRRAVHAVRCGAPKARIGAMLHQLLHHF